MPGAGQLDRPIEIHQPVGTRDAYGQTVETWQLLCSPWALVRFGGGAEGMRAEGIASANQVTFTIRWRPGIRPNMRVKHRGEWYKIDAVQEPDRNGLLDLVCTVFDHRS